MHIINTGGTFGMAKNADGSLAPVEGYATQRISKMEELQEESMPLISIEE